METNDVLFTPVFTGTKYKHHLCSECGYQIHLEQSCFGGIDFPYGKEGFRFCPGCGKPVSRFSEKAIYEEPIDFSPLKPFGELFDEYTRKCEWLYYVGITPEQQEKVNDVLPFAKEKYGWTKNAYDSVAYARRYKMNHHRIKRLIKEFGEG